MLRVSWKGTLILTLLFITSTQLAFGQTGSGDEPLFEQLSETFKKKYLSIGVLLQTVGDFQIERNFAGNNGFNIANLRLNVGGELDDGFGYFLQTNFAGSPSILDAKMLYKISSILNIDVGLFKAPFSKEFLTSAASIDFVNRSQIVTALAPGREIGVMLSGWFAPDVLSWSAGLFNGNRFGPNNNDNDNFLYVGRAAFFPQFQSRSENLEIGFNLGISEDDNANLGSLDASFNGTRFLIGGDVRWTRDNMLVSGEVIYASLDPEFGPTANPFGFHVTAGYMLNPKTQVLARLDSLDPDGLQDDSHLIVLGLNHWPTQATEVQVNYVIPTEDGGIDHNQLLINAQVSF